MKSYIAILVLALATSALASQSDYYWKEYRGYVPFDALRVFNWKLTRFYHIGQGYFPGAGLLPGMIQPGRSELKAVTNGRVVTIEDNIKILCSNSSNIFRWMPINYDNLKALGKMDFLELVNGGTESDSDLYIGRFVSSDYMNIGKIYTLEPYQGLTIPNSQGKVTVYKNFEVLVLVKLDGDYPRYMSRDLYEDEEFEPRTERMEDYSRENRSD